MKVSHPEEGYSNPSRNVVTAAESRKPKLTRSSEKN
jgi:hypothetical protein